ncbi:MAG: acyl carrier protein [Candidatus Competibacteraceae bacterium]
MSIKQTVRRYILENLLFTDDESILQDDDSFLAMGIIDSLNALEIAYFIEESFGFKVSEDEMLPENLDSINRLVAFIECKRGLPSLRNNLPNSITQDTITLEALSVISTTPVAGHATA